MGKTIEDLQKSRDFRQEFIAKYGEILLSVWDIDFSKNKSSYEFADRIADDKRLRKYHQHENRQLAKAFSSSGSGVRGKEGGLSRFPLDLAMRIIKFYSEEGETIFDPCHGHVYENRLYAAYRLKRKYIGYDICKEYNDQNLILIEFLLGNKDQPEMFVDTQHKPEIYNKSSEKVHLPNNSVDLVFTSPPYWDLEFYDENPQQYGYKKTYEQFLAGMQRMVNEMHRILKPGKICALNVNDFRKEGKFYAYHSDVINLGLRAGFGLHDIVIINWGSSLQACFASQIEERKMTAKVHEYLIVFRKEKGDVSKSKGGKDVLPQQWQEDIEGSDFGFGQGSGGIAETGDI